MRRLIAVSIIGLCLAGAALAQGAPSNGRFEPNWTREPTAADFADYYPSVAMERGRDGLAYLCCVPQDDGSLDCRIGLEWPERQGFGLAALRLSDRYRMSREEVARFRTDPNAWIQVPLAFIMGGYDRGFNEERARISQANQDLCRPAVSAQ
jgi:hypothetical protein